MVMYMYMVWRVCVSQVFILACLFGELWMFGVLGVIGLLVCYVVYGRASSSSSSSSPGGSSTGMYSFELENAVSR